ncbi:Flap-structured DNA-binding and RNA-binding protein [Entomophthora muscae]|uniref:Flap-structured DNA-binding and RNA-binding protein n=1 Tax=Entomophthora muscae TaxID=34485 RepID=A0ACC2TC13_9FUNG|nr:Flap-structured DNA-binding and RNA-binding protein [Entomophthora muscae]
MGPPYFSSFSTASPANWLGFKEKQKRRSYGDHDIFPQAARGMFSSLPSTFKKHLMKPQNKVDFEILQDVPAWLRSLRLHKYTDVFEGMVWQDIIKMNDEELIQKGISALGARRKMLKHFELIKQELQNKNKDK